MQRCPRLLADMTLVRSSGGGERDRAAGTAPTIQIVANQQSDALRQQQRRV
jgi:hypothetical protein